MYLIKEISRKNFDPSFIHDLNQKYKVRKAARAILLNRDKIAILSVTNQHIHKIPGGGIEEGEDIKKGLEREILEETGCRANIEKELGITIEYRDEFEQIQISYIFVASVIGEPGEVNFTQDELADGFTLEWIDLNQVIDILEKDNPADYSDNKYINLRDKEIVKFYLKQNEPTKRH